MFRFRNKTNVAIAVDKHTHTAVIENSCILYYDVLDYKM